jgi:acetolactate decarboxylase
MKTTEVFFIVLSLVACSSPKKEMGVWQDANATGPDRELIYHYSVWAALVNHVWEGNLSVKELKSKGDIGLGTFNSMNGEMIILDGQIYQVAENGSVGEPGDDSLVPYAITTYFDEDLKFEISEPTGFDMLKKEILSRIPSKNYLYAIRIRGKFSYIKCGGATRQEKPYQLDLEEFLRVRPVYEKENAEGILVGFLCPDFIENINVPGLHLHFISDDKQFGGHVMEFDAKQMHICLDITRRYQFVLPETVDFRKTDFVKKFNYGR